MNFNKLITFIGLVNSNNQVLSFYVSSKYFACLQIINFFKNVFNLACLRLLKAWQQISTNVWNFRVICLVSSIDDMDHVWTEYKRNPISFYRTKLLSITQKLSKVNVKQMTRVIDHNVIIVPVSNAHDVGENTVAST